MDVLAQAMRWLTCLRVESIAEKSAFTRRVAGFQVVAQVCS
jgi:hypothetical protein